MAKDILEHVGPMDTTHTISNVRVSMKDGANTVSFTSLVLAQHALPGQGKGFEFTQISGWSGISGSPRER
jgi:hypothetical protein